MAEEGEIEFVTKQDKKCYSMLRDPETGEHGYKLQLNPGVMGLLIHVPKDASALRTELIVSDFEGYSNGVFSYMLYINKGLQHLALNKPNDVMSFGKGLAMIESELQDMQASKLYKQIPAGNA